MVSPASAGGTCGLCLRWGESQGSVGEVLLMWSKLLSQLLCITFIQHQIPPPDTYRHGITGELLAGVCWCTFSWEAAVMVMHLSKSLVRSCFAKFHKYMNNFVDVLCLAGCTLVFCWTGCSVVTVPELLLSPHALSSSWTRTACGVHYAGKLLGDIAIPLAVIVWWITRSFFQVQ